MSEVTLFKTLETPTSWRCAIPGVVLTSGMENPITIKLRKSPDSADEAKMEGGSISIKLCRIPDVAEIIEDFGSFPIKKDATEVVVNLNITNRIIRGYYRLHIVQRNSEGKVLGVYHLWVAVDQAVEPVSDNYMEVESVRSQFADICGDDNKLLEGHEIGVGDIAEAVNRCLQQWVATPPRITKYAGDNFPYAELLRNGVIMMMLQSVCTLLDRNRLGYQAEGVSVDLEKRTDFYKQLLAQYTNNWRSGMMQMKNEENMMSFNGSLIYE